MGHGKTNSGELNFATARQLETVEDEFFSATETPAQK